MPPIRSPDTGTLTRIVRWRASANWILRPVWKVRRVDWRMGRRPNPDRHRCTWSQLGFRRVNYEAEYLRPNRLPVLQSDRRMATNPRSSFDVMMKRKAIFAQLGSLRIWRKSVSGLRPQSSRNSTETFPSKLANPFPTRLVVTSKSCSPLRIAATSHRKVVGLPADDGGV